MVLQANQVSTSNSSGLAGFCNCGLPTGLPVAYEGGVCLSQQLTS